MTDVAELELLQEIGNELLEHLERAGHSEFEPKDAVEVFREWRAALRGMPEVEQTLADWADAPSNLTKLGSAFSAAIDSLNGSLAANAQLISRATRLAENQHLASVQWETPFIQFLAPLEREASFTAVPTLADLKNIGKQLQLMSAFAEDKPELDGVRNELLGVIETTKRVLQSPELVHIAGAATLLQCDTDDFVLQPLSDPDTAKGFCDFVKPVLLKLHRTRRELKLTGPQKLPNNENLQSVRGQTTLEHRNEDETHRRPSRRKRKPDLKNTEWVKQILVSHHLKKDEVDFTPLSTRDIEKLSNISDTTARIILGKLFGSVGKYREACERKTIILHLKVFSDGLTSLGTVDPSKFSEILNEDRTLIRMSRRSKPVEDED